MSIPRIALIATTWYEASHADILGRALIAGYEWDGAWSEPRVEVVGVHLEQRGISKKGRTKPDIGVDFLTEHGIPLFDTPAEALGAGRPGVNVDGVMIIGEHGDYEDNEYGQKLYPRRRLYDAVLSAMIATDTFVPVFNDKHLAWNFTDAKAMYDSAQRFGIALSAGSTVPVGWRLPAGTQWPLGAGMDRAMMVTFSGFEVYGFHGLEGLLAFTERRAGGESGVADVQGFTGDRVAEGIDLLDQDLLRDAMAVHGLVGEEIDDAVTRINHVVIISHRDGLRSAMAMTPAISSFSVVAEGPQDRVEAELRLHPGTPHGHFWFLARGFETSVLTGTSTQPVERTLLAGGILDHAIRNHHGVVDASSPELDISYQVGDVTLDTGILSPLHHHGDVPSQP